MSGQEAAALVYLLGAIGIAAIGAPTIGFMIMSLETGRRARWLEHNEFYKWRDRGGFTQEPPESWADRRRFWIIGTVAGAFAAAILAFTIAGLLTLAEAPATSVPHGTGPAAGTMIPPASS